ncbi:MAG: hypothetical protein WC837_04425 [Bellilinea sp.]
MKRPIQKPDWAELQQRPLGLDIDEVEPGIITPDEARMRSEAARKLFDDVEHKPDWFARYAELRAAGWNWRVAAYIAWASCPRRDRIPASQELLATQVLGLTSDRQIWTWRTKNPAIDETIGLLQAAPLFEHRADILRALIDSATNADYKHHQDRKIALEMLGDYVPRIKVDSDRKNLDDLDQLSEAELREIAARGNPVENSTNEAADAGDE